MASMTRSTVGPSEQTLLLVQCSCTTVYTVLYSCTRKLGQELVQSCTNRARTSSSYIGLHNLYNLYKLVQIRARTSLRTGELGERLVRAYRTIIQNRAYLQ